MSWFMPFKNDKFNTILIYLQYFVTFYQDIAHGMVSRINWYIKVANIADTRKTTQQGQIQATTG